jgi:oxygen-independent coproporphyrinogen-3 oxidase
MRPETTAAILDRIAARWAVDPDAEITLEANPNSVEAARFRGFRDAGINRVSIGVQSLRDDQLRKLGRIHNAAEARAAIDIARGTFARFSFDLIYARPGQTVAEWRGELAEALAIAGDHLSLYQLTIEPDTPFAALHAAGKLVVPDEDAARELYEVTGDLMASQGFSAYEVSNYARPGAESRHNLLYWRYGEYAGIGPGAHGRIIVDGRRRATVAERNPEAWAARVETTGSGAVESITLTRAEQADEMLLMGLRLREGIDVDELQSLGGVRLDPEVIGDLVRLGLLQVSSSGGFEGIEPTARRATSFAPVHARPGSGLRPDAATPSTSGLRIRATPSGRLVLNAVVAKLSRSFAPARAMDNAVSAL